MFYLTGKEQTDIKSLVYCGPEPKGQIIYYILCYILLIIGHRSSSSSDACGCFWEIPFRFCPRRLMVLISTWYFNKNGGGGGKVTSKNNDLHVISPKPQ